LLQYIKSYFAQTRRRGRTGNIMRNFYATISFEDSTPNDLWRFPSKEERDLWVEEGNCAGVISEAISSKDARKKYKEQFASWKAWGCHKTAE